MKREATNLSHHLGIGGALTKCADRKKNRRRRRLGIVGGGVARPAHSSTV